MILLFSAFFWGNEPRFLPIFLIRRLRAIRAELRSAVYGFSAVCAKNGFYFVLFHLISPLKTVSATVSLPVRIRNLPLLTHGDPGVVAKSHAVDGDVPKGLSAMAVHVVGPPSSSTEEELEDEFRDELEEPPPLQLLLGSPPKSPHSFEVKGPSRHSPFIRQ
jgi:hypothetical protein